MAGAAEQESSNLRRGPTGDGGGWAASGVILVASSPTMIDDGGGGKTGLEKYSVKSPQDLLVLESVDEDAEDADATLLDEFIMLAPDSPIWEELKRHLKERKMRENRWEAVENCWDRGMGA